MCCKLGLKIWASEEASNWYLTTRSRPWSWQPAHDPPCLNLTLKIGFLFASWIELFVNIALQHLKTLWWYCPNLNQDSVWPHPKSPFSPQNLMSPQCNWTLGNTQWVCCVVTNAIEYWDASERKGKISRVAVVTRLPVNLILRIWFLPVELHNWLVGWLGGCSCKTSYEANREGRPGLAIQHSCLCLSHTSMNDRWNNFGPRVFQGNKKEFQNETREHVLDLCLALFTFLWLENKWGPISHL